MGSLQVGKGREGETQALLYVLSIIGFFMSGNVLGQGRGGRDEFETPLSPFAVPPAAE